MIDPTGKERLLLRNPADFKGGFWASYIRNGKPFCVESTESESISVAEKVISKGRLEVSLYHTPEGETSPVVRFDLNMWSLNTPVLLIRHSTVNTGKELVEDARIYSFFDFDIGGPTSYKDDTGVYDAESGLLTVFDESPLFVAMASRQNPAGWEISPPLKLKVANDKRDLRNNLELGPLDIAAGMQWNLGDLEPSGSESIDLAIVSASSLEDVKTLISKAWEVFDKRIQ